MKRRSLVLVGLLLLIASHSNASGLLDNSWWPEGLVVPDQVVTSVSGTELSPTNRVDLAKQFAMTITNTKSDEKIGVVKFIDTFMPRIDPGAVEYKPYFRPLQWEGGSFYTRRFGPLHRVDSVDILAYNLRLGERTLGQIRLETATETARGFSGFVGIAIRCSLLHW